MASDTQTAASQPSTAQADKSDGKKSGNVTVDQVRTQFLKREMATTKETQSSETIAKAADVATGTTATTSEPAETKTATETTAQEVKAEAKAETAQTKLDDALSKATATDDPKTQSKLERRIQELVNERNQAEAEVARLKARAPSLPAPVPTPDNPLAHIEDPESFLKEEKTVRDVKKWAQRQLDRDDIDQGVKDGDKTYSKQDLKTIVRNAEEMLEEHLPARRKFLEQRHGFIQRATEAFPWMKDQASPEFAKYQMLVRDPNLAKLANAPWVANLLIQGERDLERQIAEAGKGSRAIDKTKEKAPSLQTASGAAPGPVREAGSTRAAQELADSMKRLSSKRNVSVKDAAKFFQQKENTNR